MTLKLKYGAWCCAVFIFIAFGMTHAAHAENDLSGTLLPGPGQAPGYLNITFTTGLTNWTGSGSTASILSQTSCDESCRTNQYLRLAANPNSYDPATISQTFTVGISGTYRGLAYFEGRDSMPYDDFAFAKLDGTVVWQSSIA